MKQVVINRYGRREEVTRSGVPDVGAPAEGKVVLDVLDVPINPAGVEA